MLGTRMSCLDLGYGIGIPGSVSDKFINLGVGDAHLGFVSLALEQSGRRGFGDDIAGGIQEPKEFVDLDVYKRQIWRYLWYTS